MDENESETSNMWSLMLKEARESSKGSGIETEKSTLFVLGDPKCGKTSMLSKWKDRVASNSSDIPEYVADYSYVNCKNKFNVLDSQVISRLGVWQLGQQSHGEILPNLTCDPSVCAFVICLDLSTPHFVIKSMKEWIKVYKSASKELLGKYSDEKAAALKLKLSTYVQTFEDPTAEKKVEAKEPATPAATEGETAPAPAGEEAAAPAPAPAAEEAAPVEAVKEIDPKIPAVNTGIPLFVVGTKADTFEKVNDDEKFSFIVRRLRQECLKYGATLIFTSAIGEGVGTDILRDHIYHRLLNLELDHKPKMTGKCSSWQIHVPAGLDSEDDIPKSNIKDGTSLVDVFEYVEKKKTEQKDEVITARSDQEFFDSLRGKLGNGRRQKDSGNPSKKKKEKAVKSFFKSLLDENNK